jgi:hypothetical protein
MNANTIAPVIKRITLGVAPVVAFNAYVNDMSAWWPLETVSVSLSAKATVRVDDQVHGRIVEVAADGSEHTWGTILAFTRPLIFGHSWHPGNSPGLATIVHVIFEPIGDGGTHLLLMHSGWEARAKSTEGVTKDAKEIRKQYDSGWNFVLACFSRHVHKQDMVEL